MNTIASPMDLAEIASLMGDVSRARILVSLMDGRALTAGELGFEAGISAATASGHLMKLLDGQLVAVKRQGRHRYYRLDRPDIATAIEALMTTSVAGPTRHRPMGPRDEAMRIARSCYDHLAGKLGVGIADALSAAGHIELCDGAAMVTNEGHRFLCDVGIDLDAGGPSKRPLCRTCLDWSERRPHLAGRLGAALLDRFLMLDWIARVPGSRALHITGTGRLQFRDQFRIELV